MTVHFRILQILKDERKDAEVNNFLVVPPPSPRVYSDGFYVDISNQCQMQQYNSCLKSLVLQKYQNFTGKTSNMIYTVAFGVGLKCPRKICLNTQCPLPPPLPMFGPSAASVCDVENFNTCLHFVIE